MPYLETIDMTESEEENKEVNESDDEAEVSGDAGSTIIEKKENEKKNVNADNASAGEKEGVDDFVPGGNDSGNEASGVVGNDDGVGTINVPSGGEKIRSGEGKKPTEMKKPSVIKKGGSEGSVPPGGEKVGSGEGKKPVEMKKPGAVKKGGGEVSVGGGGVGLPSGDNVPMSGTTRKKIHLLLPEDLEQVTFRVEFLIRMIRNGSNFFL